MKKLVTFLLIGFLGVLVSSATTQWPPGKAVKPTTTINVDNNIAIDFMTPATDLVIADYIFVVEPPGPAPMILFVESTEKVTATAPFTYMRQRWCSPAEAYCKDYHANSDCPSTIDVASQYGLYLC